MYLSYPIRVLEVKEYEIEERIKRARAKGIKLDVGNDLISIQQGIYNLKQDQKEREET